MFYDARSKSLSYQLLCSGNVVVIDEWLQAGELPFFCLSTLCVSVCPFAGRQGIYKAVFSMAYVVTPCV